MLFYDYEVFKYDWLTVIGDTETQTFKEIVNDPEALTQFHKEHESDIWIGFNNVHYDQYIHKSILCGLDPYQCNCHIIQKNLAGYTFSNLFKQIKMINYDVMLRTDRGLKTFEGFLGHSVVETSVPFDIDRPLTKEEIKQTLFYCHHDVEETMEVFMKRIDEFNTMMYFIKHFGYPLQYLEKTKPQLASIMLGGNGKGKHFDPFDFPILDCLDLGKYRYIADWYKSNHDYSKSQDVIVAGVPHTYSWGGGHGALSSYHAEGVFIIIDVTAYYPSLQQKYHFGYEVMDNPENFEFIHGSNILYKKKGDKKARLPFKIMDNAISGQMKQSTSRLFCPNGNNAICVNGQLLLLDLVAHLEPYVDLIQNNTDGIIVKVRDYNRDFDLIDDVVYEWEQRTGMTMEFDTFIGEIYQKDVNNYILIDRETGSVKAKGAYIKKLSDLDYDLPIVNKAMNKYFIEGIPVEDTILSCDDLKEFQMVRKISSKYSHILHGGHWTSIRKINPKTGKLKTFTEFRGTRKKVNEKCVRVFASMNQSDGGLWKVKLDGSIAKMEGTPEHCFIYNEAVNDVRCPKKLDKQWYITTAKERLKGFGCE